MDSDNIKGCSFFLFYFFLICVCIVMANLDDITEWYNKAEITVKGENGEKFHSYQAACEALDFTAAHQYVIKMEEALTDGKSIRQGDISEAKDYIFKKEVTYLLLEGGDNGVVRSLYLIKELPDSVQIKNGSFVVDLAIMGKNSSLAKDVLGVMTNSVKFFQKTEGASGEFQDVIDNIQLYNKTCESVLDYAISQKDMELANYVLSILVQDAELDKNQQLRYSNQTKTNAQKKFTGAVRSKAFQ